MAWITLLLSACLSAGLISLAPRDAGAAEQLRFIDRLCQR